MGECQGAIPAGLQRRSRSYEQHRGQERYDWLRSAFMEEATRRIGEQRAGMLYHAIDTVFSASFPERVPRVGRDLDATAYTLDFNATIRSFNSWLIRKLVDRVDELERLNS
jgi:hypothetical protein